MPYYVVMDKEKTPIERASDLFGSQSALASLLGVSPPTVNQWIKGIRPIPPEHCTTIERVTKCVVTRQELRPHDFWKIWPDLAHLAPTHDITTINIDASDQERRDSQRRDAERREDERRTAGDKGVANA